ncbi:MAG: ABC transporter permease subunit [Wujia sp.]
MSTTYAFFKKEWLEYYRTGKLAIFGAVFVLFGLMNPAITKLTPFLMEQIASQESAGLSIEITVVDASMSWTQFYKNIPMALLVSLMLFGGILTNELQKGTLISVLTKGMSRWKILLIKGINLFILWTIGYWICFGITYFYNDFYWDNSVFEHVGFAAGCYWLFGCLILSWMMLFSAMASSMGGVMLGVGGCYFVMTLMNLASSLSDYLPTHLTAGVQLFVGGNPRDYMSCIIVTVVLMILNLVSGCLWFEKREL